MNRCNARTRLDKRCRNKCTKGLATCYVHSDECCVCLDRLGAGSVICKLVCGHIFHDRCIQRWINSDGRCPVCRFICRAPVVTVHDLSDVFLPESLISTILRRLYHNGELNTTSVTVVTENDSILVNDYSSGTLIGTEPFSLWRHLYKKDTWYSFL